MTVPQNHIVLPSFSGECFYVCVRFVLSRTLGVTFCFFFPYLSPSADDHGLYTPHETLVDGTGDVGRCDTLVLAHRVKVESEYPLSALVLLRLIECSSVERGFVCRSWVGVHEH